MKCVVISSSSSDRYYVDVSSESLLVKFLFWMNLHPGFIVEKIYSSKNLITYELLNDGYCEKYGEAIKKLNVDIDIKKLQDVV